MKGVIFNILEEMVIDQCGMEIWNDILETQQISGIYTAGESYPDDELFGLVTCISEKTQIPVETLISAFGEFLFTRLAERYPIFIEAEATLKGFLKSVDEVIHMEVRKLYENPNLPEFDCEELTPNELKMRYRSPL